MDWEVKMGLEEAEGRTWEDTSHKHIILNSKEVDKIIHENYTQTN